MSKLLLTISSSYLPKWGTYEGIRELLQNAKDAEVEHGAQMTVVQENETLKIQNDGCILPLKALLLGHTSKVGKSNMIGQFGEGLKLGIMALIRAGHPVKIRNGSEVWVPTLTHDDRFDEKVLSFTIMGGRESKNRIRFEIGNITKASWAEMKGNFLFLGKDTAQVKAHDGDLLLDPAMRGKIYAKGIFVQYLPEMFYGFNITAAGCELDRDRKMVESFNLRYYTRNILIHAIAARTDLHSNFADLLESASMDVEGIMDGCYGLSEETVNYVHARFVSKHGDKAVPVTSLAESQEVEFLGRKGILVSRPLAAVLSKKMGTAESLKRSLAKESIREYAWSELNAEEQSVLETAIRVVNQASPVTLAQVSVVDFRSETLLGQYLQGQIKLAKKSLHNLQETLATLVHEVAHGAGGDGEHAHVSAIERIWSTIAINLLNANKA